jgi:hypothetical protein
MASSSTSCATVQARPPHEGGVHPAAPLERPAEAVRHAAGAMIPVADAWRRLSDVRRHVRDGMQAEGTPSSRPCACRTLMRSPVVKRQTLPRSGFFVFFPLFRAGDVSGSWRVLTAFPCAGAEAVWLHQTLIEARSPIQRRVQRNGRCVLYGLETYRGPCTVLVKRGAARVACASSCQARVRGRTRRPIVTLAAYNGAGAGVQSTAVGFRGQGLFKQRLTLSVFLATE